MYIDDLNQEHSYNVTSGSDIIIKNIGNGNVYLLLLPQATQVDLDLIVYSDYSYGFWWIVPIVIFGGCLVALVLIGLVRACCVMEELEEFDEPERTFYVA